MAKRKTSSSSSSTVVTGPFASFTPALKLARTVTPANIIDVVATFNRDHGVVARNVGRFTGMRVMAFQNATLHANVASDWQFDDCQLLALWAMEFPAAVGRVFAINGRMGTPDAAAVRDGIGIVRGVRGDFNRTGHGDPNGAPKTPSVSYGSRRFDIVVTETNVPAPVAAPAKKTRTRKTA